jgi:hypothetical protein
MHYLRNQTTKIGKGKYHVYEVLTHNELSKNVSITYQWKRISVKAMYFGQLYNWHLGPHGKISNMVYN